MALEFQKLEVSSNDMDRWVEWMSHFGWNLKTSQRILNRSSRPVGAISYENITYIHSQTDVVDFTELLFERDKSMPNYYEICELEQEALAILPECSELRPHDPPPYKSFDEWFEGQKPTLGKTILKAIGIFIAYLSVVYIYNNFICVTFGLPVLNDVVLRFVRSPAVISMLIKIGRISDLVINALILILIYYLCNKSRKIPKSTSRQYAKKQSEYNAFLNFRERCQMQIERYERAIVRLSEIISETSALI